MSDWAEHLRLSALRFHIPPHAFWALSVKEWAALTATPPAPTLRRADLDALMRDHPDEAAQ